jgi:hypothetical protein
MITKSLVITRVGVKVLIDFRLISLLPLISYLSTGFD